MQRAYGPADADPRQHNRSRSRIATAVGWRKRVPKDFRGKGPDDSSPVRSAGLAYFKRRPSRRDDRWLLVLPRSPRDEEPNVSSVPYPRKLLAFAGRTSFFASFPAR